MQRGARLDSGGSPGACQSCSSTACSVPGEDSGHDGTMARPGSAAGSSCVGAAPPSVVDRAPADRKRPASQEAPEARPHRPLRLMTPRRTVGGTARQSCLG
eukprot:7295825-Alexandrium_andersonii.AAC.1